MKTRLTRLLHVALSFCLAFVLLLTVLPMQGLAADEAGQAVTTDISALTLENLPDVLKQELDIVDDSTAALGINTYSLKKTPILKTGLAVSDAQRLDGLTLVNPDGSKTAYCFGADIKYIDGNAIKFVDNEIVNEMGIENGKLYFYRTKSSDSMLYLPLNISNGLLFKNGDLSLILAPETLSFSSGQLKTLDNEYAVQYDNVFAKGVNLQYLSVYGGFKENIIINEKNEISEFSYILRVPGYRAELIDGDKRIAIYGKEDTEPAYVFGQPFAKDANGKITNDCSYTLTRIGWGDNYRLTLCVDEQFLNDESTAYPVTVDPPLEVSRGSVEDATVSSAGTIDTTSSTITVGIDENGNDNAAFIRCNFLWYFKHLRPDDVTSASFLTAPVSNNNANVTILSLYDSIWSFGFENLNFDKVERCQYDIQSNVMLSPVNTTCNFNITKLMQRWLRSYLAESNWKSPDYGFFIRNETTAIDLYSAESSHSFYPCFSITYDEQPAVQNGYYYIKNNQYDKYLSYSDDGQNVFIDDFSLYKDDVYTLRWYIQKVEETTYGEVFYTILPDKYSANEALGTNVTDPYVNGNNTQLNNYSVGNNTNLWRIIENADGTYRIMPAFSTTQSLTADNSGEYNAYTYEYHGWDSMRWEFEALTTGVGAAWEYTECDSPYVNCLGYALNIDADVELQLSSLTLYKTKVTTMDYVLSLGRNIYQIESYTAPIRPNEYRFCMRIGNSFTHMHNDKFVEVSALFDYHYWVQTKDGNWADKKGSLSTDKSRDLHTGNPSTFDWPMYFWCTINLKFEQDDNFYDSDTIYFAATLDSD